MDGDRAARRGALVVDDTSAILQTQEIWTPLAGSARHWQTAAEAAESPAQAGGGFIQLEQQLKTDRKLDAIDRAWPETSGRLVERYREAAKRAAKIARQASARACDAMGLDLDLESRALAEAPTVARPGERPTKSAGEWHAKRAARLERRPSEVQDTCGRMAVTIECGCQRLAVPAGCGRPAFCASCEQRKRARVTSRVKRAIYNLGKQGWLDGRRGPGRRLQWYLVTFTASDTGDPEADRRDLAASFNRWRSWLWGRIGTACPYVLAWEITPGATGRGHVHAHALMRLPFVSFEEAGEAWKRATHGRAGDNGLDFGRKDAEGNNRKAPTVHEAARYVAKYLAKGASAKCSPELVAQWYCAQYARRSYSASQGFWTTKLQPCACGQCGVVWQFAGIIEAPEVLKTGSPTTVARQILHALE